MRQLVVFPGILLLRSTEYSSADMNTEYTDILHYEYKHVYCIYSVLSFAYNIMLVQVCARTFVAMLSVKVCLCLHTSHTIHMNLSPLFRCSFIFHIIDSNCS